MHHTSHVSKYSVPIFLFAYALVSAVGQSTGQPNLDLTLTPSAAHRSMGVPGNSMSSGNNRGKLFELPLSLAVEDVHVGPQDTATLRLKVVNIGDEVFNIPACTDEITAHGDQAKGRRTMQFGVELLDANRRPLGTQVAGVTFSSSSDEGCNLPIAPGKAISVKIRAKIANASTGTPAGDEPSYVEATLSELRLSDTSFTIEDVSAPVRSKIAQLK